MRYRATAFRLCVALFFLVLAHTPAWCAPAQEECDLLPLAGCPITNRARVTYIDTDSGYASALDSNTVRIVIQPLESLRLTRDQAVTAAPGAPVSLTHHLTNTGNATSSYTLDLQNVSFTDDYDLANLFIVHDVNENGRSDPGEPEIEPGQEVTLAPLASITLIINGSVPAGIAIDRTAEITLSATSVSQRARVTNTDRLSTRADAVVQIFKATSRLTAQPGDEVTFTLTGVNTGQADATPHSAGQFTVDGQPVELVVLRDAIPANTTFVSAVAPGNAAVLYHLRGTPGFHAYTASAPAPGLLPQVDAVAFGLSSIPVGHAFGFAFTVAVNPIASGSVDNIAHLHYDVPSVPAEQPASSSNQASVSVPYVPPLIRFFDDPAYTQTTCSTSVGSPLFIQVDSGTHNRDPTAVETVEVTVGSASTGDVEVVTAVETGPNTGVFRVRLLTTQRGDPTPGTLMTDPNDRIAAGIAGYLTQPAIVLVDPWGHVFDSRTNQPVADARVFLYYLGADPNAPSDPQLAEVFDTDGATPMPNPATTGTDGIHRFPSVAGGFYQVRVELPNGYTFPSRLPPDLMPPARVIHRDGSFGSVFEVATDCGAIQLDVPVDSGPPAGLFVEKEASRVVVEIGEFLVYRLTVTNATGYGLTGISVADVLPPGFVYREGSARTDGTAIADPRGSRGRRLEFHDVTDLPVDAKATLSYRVVVGPGVRLGKNVNSARASGDSPFGVSVSNLASAEVEVKPGVFTDKGVIFGTVFVDRNGNEVQDEGEPGIPGVRLYLETGTFVITDTAGQYSIYGISAKTHVLKVDSTTLPAGAVLAPLSQRHAGAGDSCFVDLHRGELHKVNFAETSASEAVLAQVRQRRERAPVYAPETERSLETELSEDGSPQGPRNIRALPAFGAVDEGTPVAAFSPVVRRPFLSDANSPLPPSPVSPTPSVPVAERLQALTKDFGFVDLRDGDTLPAAQTTILVKGTFGARFTLEVNGESVPEARVGTKAGLPDRQVQIWEYVAVDLQAGENVVQAAQWDTFGNQRGSMSVTVVAPGDLATLEVVLPEAMPPADGVTAVPLTVRLADERGVPVTARTPLTLESELGLWDVADLDAVEPGTQVFVTGGEAVFSLIPPANPGRSVVRARSGRLESSETLTFSPNLRPLIAAGVVEGKLNLRHLKEGELAPPGMDSLFEDEIQNLDELEPGSSTRGGGRAAFFVKGKIRGDYLLTAAYDSDKDTRERLFRDIQPDEFYPVYGDSSVRGYDAQSTGRFYVRVDKNSSYLLYGDYSTLERVVVRDLGSYSRAVTGVKHHFENKRVRANVYASDDNQRQVIEEFRANGTSGPFRLSNTPVVENSEQVEVLVRDRHQPSIILKREDRSRFADYSLEPFTGRLLFKAPVPSLDPNLNPVSVLVTYETDQDGPSYWMVGGDAQVKLTDWLEVGGAWAKDENPQEPYELRSVNTTLRLAGNTYLMAEIAESDHRDEETRALEEATVRGSGQRIELVHKGERTDLRVHAGETDPDFHNPTATLNHGRREAGLTGSVRVNEKTRLVGEGLWTEDVAAGGERKGLHGFVERHLSRNVRLELGMRWAEGTTTPAQPGTPPGTTPVDLLSVRTKLSLRPPWLARANLFAEVEQDVSESESSMFGVGGEYQVSNRGKLYARHEFISSLNGPYALNSEINQNTTVVGLDTEYVENAHLFSEYRVRDALAGPEADAAIGLRNGWPVAEGLKLHTTFERVHPLRGLLRERSTAVTGAVEYTRNPLWRGTARAEVHHAKTSDSLLSTLGYARSITEEWTFIGKNILSVTETDGTLGGTSAVNRLVLGLAFRDADTDVWNALAKYELKLERDDAPATDTSRRVHIASTTAHYQPVRRLTCTGRYAAKLVREEWSSDADDYLAHLVGTRVSVDLAKRWDASLMGAVLMGEESTNRQFGLGAEIGYLLKDDIWLSVGYNVHGFSDRDFTGSDYTYEGFYVRLRVKFDEGLFGNWRKR